MAGKTLKLDDVSFRARGNTIIRGVTLSFRPGEVFALIGPSGSGKTTALKCLAALQEASSGRVLADGRDVWPMRREHRMSLGYVPQDDIIHTALTVEEAFYYSARLRMGARLKEEALSRRLDSIAEALGLKERKGLRIRRLSGGQRKRVNIGIELLADPEVLILDEPASGLDPGTEGDLVALLRRLAGVGRTVVMTTHSMEYLDQVSRLALMVQGQVVFSGTEAEMLRHFGVGHSGEVFRRIRGVDAASLVGRYRSSPYSLRASLG